MEIDSNNILCPYCQNKCGDSDSFEGYRLFDEEAIEFECDECGKTFDGTRCVTVDYRTESDCHKNGEEHERGPYHCKKCDVYNSMHDAKEKEGEQ